MIHQERNLMKSFFSIVNIFFSNLSFSLSHTHRLSHLVREERKITGAKNGEKEYEYMNLIANMAKVRPV